MTNQWIERQTLAFKGERILEGQTDEWPAAVLEKFSSQIDFLHSFDDLGKFHFQSYRKAQVLAVGSGHFLVSLVAALFESGLSNFHVLITNSMPTDRQQLTNLAEHARLTDPGAAIGEITFQKEGRNFWREAVQPFHAILYVSYGDDIEELRNLQVSCREEKKTLLPAIFVLQTGWAGPLVHPDSEGCWESAWHRIHRSALCKNKQITFSSTAGALLANLIVFELLKTVTGVTNSELNNKCFLLDLETYEGEGHSFKPHPLVTGCMAVEWVQDVAQRLERSSGSSEPNELFAYFSRLTSAQSGIFHTWEEGDLNQLPLSQCHVQAADPLSEGPAELLPDLVCIALTHEEARREAGLAGIEAYVSRMTRRLITTLPSHQELEGGKIEPQEYIGVGAGEAFAEGMCRGLQKCLNEELSKRVACQMPAVKQVQFYAVEDERCRFYIQALTLMQGTPIIGLGEEVLGFPVVWVGSDGHWYGCTGLNKRMAMQKALEQALQQAQSETTCLMVQGMKVSLVDPIEQVPPSLVIPAGEAEAHSEVLKSATQILEQNRKRLLVFDLVLEPFLKGEPAEVFGVLLRDEVSR